MFHFIVRWKQMILKNQPKKRGRGYVPVMQRLLQLDEK